MSGFFGMFRFDGSSVPARLLDKIAATLTQRGPDGTHVWQHAGQASCFSLMRTERVDRQAAQQPVTLDEQFSIIGDIRLDGRDELIEQLKAAREFPADYGSDEDLVLHAWRFWGEDSLQRLLGDFSFALWDNNSQRIVCARDFVGARPFFYAKLSSLFCFSNTLQALRLVSEISSELDEAFIGDFLLQGWCSDPTRSAFRNIRRLAPGHSLALSADHVSIRRFQTLPIEEPLQLSSPHEYVENFRELLTRAVRDRLPDGPVSLYLSGGLDSGAISAVASQIAAERRQQSSLKAFTISCSTLFHDDEPHYAQLTAHHLRLHHQIIESSDTVPWESEPSAAESLAELTFSPFLNASRKQFQQVAAHSRVVLSGDGGDNVLTGQSWPYLSHLAKHSDWAAIAKTFGGFFLLHRKLPPLRGGFRNKARRLLGMDDVWADYPQWVGPDFETRAGLRQRWLELSRDPVFEHPIHPEAFASLNSAYWAIILEDEDAAYTDALLEARAPLLDFRVLRFLLRVPPVPWCVDKFLLREVMKSRLPPEILQRPKSPLADSPLDASIRVRQWRPLLPAQPPTPIHQFVNWLKWRGTLENSQGSLNTVNLRPFALFHWLKAIENT
jgi:asparagine synthase (glutamine-hydrolysing)